MHLRLPLLIALSIVLAGCARLERIDPPKALNIPIGSITETVKPPSGAPRTISIGDEMVRYMRHGKRPVGLQFLRKKVPTAGWQAAFRRDGQVVYNNRRFYTGHIALKLDSDLNIIEAYQIGGGKKWRKWDGERKPLFAYEPLLIESWILRYGGKVGETYRFELVERPEDSQSDVIQPLIITEQAFSEGFVVRGVTIRGLGPDRNGVIDYEVSYEAGS